MKSETLALQHENDIIQGQHLGNPDIITIHSTKTTERGKEKATLTPYGPPVTLCRLVSANSALITGIQRKPSTNPHRKASITIGQLKCILRLPITAKE